jgi:hypothetical protein
MKEKIISLVLLLGGFSFLFACATSLNQYKAGSIDEETVIEVVMEHERAWNANDAVGFLATYHESAKIEIGCNGQLFSKKEFATYIEQLMSNYPSVKLVNPSIDVSGENALVKVISTEMGEENHFFEIALLKENDQWYISHETCN